MIDMSGWLTLPMTIAQTKRKERDEVIKSMYESGDIDSDQLDRWLVKSTQRYADEIDRILEAGSKSKEKSDG